MGSEKMADLSGRRRDGVGVMRGMRAKREKRRRRRGVGSWEN